jgi:protein-S-isoprenylcysteine O-methyltransferase Ste14
MTPELTPRTDRPSAVPWPPILLLAVIVVGWLLGRNVPLGWTGQDDGPARFIGLGFGAVGLMLVTWAVLTLRRHHTTFMPTTASSALVTDGPYAWRRNPIYLGEILMLFGVAELTKNIWFVILAFVFGLAVTVLQVIPEERHLAATFGDAWRTYAAKTRRWI